MPEQYPPGAFHFTVHLLGSATSVASVSGAASQDSRFQEVSGMDAEWDVETVAEGGENRFQHQLPTRAKYTNLMLKRGAVTGGSPLLDWVGGTIGSSLAAPVDPQNLMVMLLDEGGDPLVTWVIVHAYPVKWSTSGLNSMNNEVLIETLELAYSYFWRNNHGSTMSGARIGAGG